MVILNPSDQSASTEFLVNFPCKQFKLLAGTKIPITQNNSTIHLKIPGSTYAIYKVK